MKKIRIALIWIVSVGLFIGVIISLAGIFYLETSIDTVLSKEEQQKLFTEIEDCPELPHTFYETIEHYRPDYFETGIYGSIIRQLSGGRRNECQCREVYLPAFYHSAALAPEIISRALENRYSQRTCFEYNMSISDFGSVRGVSSAAALFYHKTLSELNEREILELTFIRTAPAYYNPVVHRERLTRAVDELMSNTEK